MRFTNLPVAWKIFLAVLAIHIFELFVTYIFKLFKSNEQIKYEHTLKLLQEQQIKLKVLDQRQDFTIWSKSKRTVDKLEMMAEKSKQETVKNKSFIERNVGTFFMIIKYCLYAYATFTYKNIPMYQLPSAILYPVSWIPSLPYLSSGSISVVFWLFTCNKIVSGIKV